MRNMLYLKSYFKFFLSWSVIIVQCQASDQLPSNSENYSALMAQVKEQVKEQIEIIRAIDVAKESVASEVLSDEASCRVAYFYIQQCSEIPAILALAAYIDYHKKTTFDQFCKAYADDTECAFKGLSYQDSSVLQHMKMWAQQYQEFYANHPALQKYPLGLKKEILTDAVMVNKEITPEIIWRSYDQDSKNSSLTSAIGSYFATSLKLYTMKQDMLGKVSAEDFNIDKMKSLPPILLRHYNSFQTEAVADGHFFDKRIYYIAHNIVKTKLSIKDNSEWNQHNVRKIFTFSSIVYPLFIKECKSLEEQTCFLNILYSLSKNYTFPDWVKDQEKSLIQESLRLVFCEKFNEKRQEQNIKKFKENIAKLAIDEDRVRKETQGSIKKTLDWMFCMTRNQFKIGRDYDAAITNYEAEVSKFVAQEMVRQQTAYQYEESRLRQKYIQESDSLVEKLRLVFDVFLGKNEVLWQRQKLADDLFLKKENLLDQNLALAIMYMRNQTAYLTALHKRAERETRQFQDEGVVAASMATTSQVEPEEVVHIPSRPSGSSVEPVRNESRNNPYLWASQQVLPIDFQDSDDLVMPDPSLVSDRWEVSQESPHRIRYWNPVTEEVKIVRQHNPYALQ